MPPRTHIFLMLVAVVEVDSAAESPEAQVITTPPAPSSEESPVAVAPVPPTLRCPSAPRTLRGPFGLTESEVRRG